MAYYTAPLRRFGVSALARYLVMAVGLVAMTLYTVPEARASAGVVLATCLWCCWTYFVVESGARAVRAVRVGRVARVMLSPSGIVDLAGILPVPIALAAGVPAPTAWLLASLWVIKLAQDSPGFAQLRRVFVLEAKPLASVFALFLIVLFLSSAAMHVIERRGQPDAFGTMPSTLWWAVVTLTTTGYGDEVPQTPLGHLLGAVVMISGIATFGLWTGILATGFAAESRRRNFIQTWDLVSKVPFFQTLDPSAITEITHMLRRLEVPERTAVIRRGKVGDCMYFIADGEVAVDVAAVSRPPWPRRVLRRACLARRFDPQRQCDDHAAIDLADPRSRRFPHRDGAPSRTCPRHRRRRQTAPQRQSAPARSRPYRRLAVLTGAGASLSSSSSRHRT